MRVFISSILADTSALNDCHWLSARSAVSVALSATAARVASAFALAAAMRALICSLVSLREASSDAFRSATRACSESTCSDKPEQVRDVLAAKIKTLPDSLRLSLTWDQGPQMREWKHVSIDAGIDIYFCRPALAVAARHE